MLDKNNINSDRGIIGVKTSETVVYWGRGFKMDYLKI